MAETLRQYVMEGGGLLLTSRSGWYLDSIFPEMFLRDGGDLMTNAPPYYRNNEYMVVKEHRALGAVPAQTRFTGESPGHRAFEPGPVGKAVIEDIEGRPVYIVGNPGKGRLVVSGSYYGDSDQLSGAEKNIFFNSLDWLAGD